MRNHLVLDWWCLHAQFSASNSLAWMLQMVTANCNLNLEMTNINMKTFHVIPLFLGPYHYNLLITDISLSIMFHLNNSHLKCSILCNKIPNYETGIVELYIFWPLRTLRQITLLKNLKLNLFLTLIKKIQKQWIYK